MVSPWVPAFGLDPLFEFFRKVLPGELQTGAIAANPTGVVLIGIRRQFAALLPWLDPAILPLVGLAVVGPLVLACYRRLETTTDRFVAVYATLLGTLLWLLLAACLRYQWRDAIDGAPLD